MLTLRTLPVSYAHKLTKKKEKNFYTVNKNIKPTTRPITVSESDLDHFSRVTEE